MCIQYALCMQVSRGVGFGFISGHSELNTLHMCNTVKHGAGSKNYCVLYRHYTYILYIYHISCACVHVSRISCANVCMSVWLQVPRGVGSGFVWDTRGHIVTNAHVVGGWWLLEAVATSNELQ